MEGKQAKLITVWGNAEFGSEMAAVAAKHTDKEILVADIDRFNSTLDLYFNIKKGPDKVKAYLDNMDNTGLLLAMDAINKKILSNHLLSEITISKKGYNNLHILTGNYNLSNIEYFVEENIEPFVDACIKSYDLVVFIAGDYLYDYYLFHALLKSDVNIIACSADIITLRKYNRHIKFLEDKQGIPADKTKFVAWEYKKGLELDESVMFELAMKNYIGHISYNPKRVKWRNRKSSYAMHLDKKTTNEYLKILESPDININGRKVSRIKEFIYRNRILGY